MSYLISMRETFTTQRSAEDTFNYIVDFSRITEWDHTIVAASKATTGDIGLNTQFDLMYSMGFRKVPIAYQIIEFEPNNRAVLVGQSKNFTAQDTVIITPLEDGSIGGCKVVWQADITFSGFMAKIIPFIEKKVMAAGSQTIVNLHKVLNNDLKNSV